MNDYQNIPAEMRARKQWVCYRIEADPQKPDKKPAKVPYQLNGAHASSTKPGTWSTFEAASAAVAANKFAGISYALAPTDNLVCVDLDVDARNPDTGEPAPWAAEIIAALVSYTEVSPSGTGYHIWVRGTIPKASHKGKVELYCRDKIMATTGNLGFSGGCDTIQESGALASIFQRAEAGEWGGTKQEPATAQEPQASGGGDSEADYRLIGEVFRKLNTRNIAAIEAEIKAKHPERYNTRNRAKGTRNGHTYFWYSIDNFLRRNPPATAAAPQEPPPEIVTPEQELGLPDMPASVLDGWLGEICRTRLSKFPISIAWPALVTVAGTLVPKTADSFRTNLFCALVAPVNAGKSQAVEAAVSVLGLQEPTLQNLMAGSAEGLLQRLGSSNGSPRLVNVDELGHLLSKSKIQNASFPYVLNRAFYQSKFALTVAHRKEIEFNCSLSLLGGVVEDKFSDVFGAESAGGLYDRFVFGQWPTGFVYNYRPFEGGSVLEEITDYDTGETLLSRPKSITIEPSVWDARDAWFVDNPNMNRRVAESAIRVAAICAAFDCRETLSGSELGPALEFAKYQMRARTLLQPAEGLNYDALCAGRIRSVLQRYAASGEWVTVRWLDKRIHAARDFGPNVFSRCLNSLNFMGIIEANLDARPRVLRLIPD